MIEVNNIVSSPFNLLILGAYIKVVGISFRDQKTLTTGQTILKEFFKTVPTMSLFTSDLEETFRYIKTSGIRWAEVCQGEKDNFIKIERQPNNPYDPNAIVVCVNYDNRFMKVGYFPKDLAEIIVTKKLKYYVVGFKKSGRGMMLTMVFESPEIQVGEPFVSPVHNENESLGFMSLNKIRRKLCK